MGNINVCVFSGNLTKDAEVRKTADGTAIVKFSIAVNGRGKQGGEWVNIANYFNCTMFGAYAEAISESLTKGTRVIVSGQAKQDRYTDRNGKNQERIEFKIDAVDIIRGKHAGELSDDLYAEDLPF